MSVYKPVYSPDGEFFEVPQHIFENLVLERGWTQTPPAPVAETKEEKPTPRRTSIKSKKDKEEEAPAAKEEAEEESAE